MPLHFLHTFLSFQWFQSRFADALLRELAGITIPPERMYALGSGLVLLFDIFEQNSGAVVHYTNSTSLINFLPQTILYFLSSRKIEVLKKLQKMPEHQGMTLQLRFMCIHRLF